MLLLDDPRWTEAETAYGTAQSIPDLLRALAACSAPRRDGDDEPWFSLWSSLCHQGNAYTASYAAVPHIVRIAGETAAPIDFSFFQLPAAIEVARRSERGPAVPPEYAEAYHQAIASLGELVNLHWYHTWDSDMLLSAMAAQAVAKGHIEIAAALLNLDEEWVERINSGDFD